jgi:flagellin-like protein
MTTVLKEISSGQSKKGITPIIAIIILLLITVALAGAAWSYINVYWSSITGKNIIIVDGFCTGGNTANVIIKNTGTLRVVLSDIEIMDSATGSMIATDLNWTSTDGTQIITSLNPSEAGKFNATCTGYCTYKFIYGGTIGLSTQPISVAC